MNSASRATENGSGARAEGGALVPDMVERVARALCAADDLDWGLQADPLHSGSGDDNQVSYRHAARAAIAAMREPTEAMLEAGDDAHASSCAYQYSAVRESFSAMIDAALSPSPLTERDE